MKEYIVSSKVYGKKVILLDDEDYDNYNKRDDVFVASIGKKFIGQSKSLEEAIKMREEAEIQKGKI